MVGVSRSPKITPVKPSRRKKKIDLDSLVLERLQKSNQRYTKSRRALVATLSANQQPLTLQEILDIHPEFTQSSTYRNLTLLEEVGVVHRLLTNHEYARFELTEEFVGHHHHTLCTVCGSVKDFTVPTKIEQELEKTFLAVAKNQGFQIATHRLDILGICKDCA